MVTASEFLTPDLILLRVHLPQTNKAVEANIICPYSFAFVKLRLWGSGLRSVLQRSHINHKAIFHIAFLHTSVGFIDILNVDHFHI